MRNNLLLAHYDLACILSLASAGRAAPGAAPHAIAPDEAARLRDRALHHLEESIHFGWTDAEKFEQDPDLDALHADPRWATLVGGLKK